ncbi:MAG TPA: protein kinase [Pyrinomonadaceae bacterium]|nr:protein kinase [Pyrinomonadaceae bacterium]
MNLESLIGQTLDSKYSIERELGRGGMGAVYLAMHIGTERPVALKVIVPQFMQRVEFVERFRREARAAGRLRHPNVVNVTDFGFAETSQGRVAYLVMEYLDGCTLGEILEEEKQLPLGWTLDILEQVCSAVHEAHGQGIIHRDLKPDNIWLEPNQRGGYTVKVLDFGIAKLEEPMSSDENEKALLNPTTTTPTQALQHGDTLADQTNAQTIIENRSATMIGEGGTLIQNPVNEKGTAIFSANDEKGTAILSVSDEKGTAIFPAAEISLEDGTAIFPDENKGTQLIEKDEKGTRLISNADTDKALGNPATAELTRVGAVLGTPLYMSPEQCRGEKLTPRSDIYSLAIIAYQMLSGKTPFTGNFTEVMDSHKEVAPPPLEAKKIPRKVKKVLFSALAKNTDERPQTAEAFASTLRAHSEGIGALFTKALAIYGEHLPKFLLLSLILAIPFFITNFAKVVVDLLVATEAVSANAVWITTKIVLSFADFFVKMFYSTMLVGATTWIVAQILAVPLRPIQIRNAFSELRKKWKPLLKTVTVSTLLALFGFVLCFFPGLYLSARYMLITPSIMMEGLSGRVAFRRSVELVKRSFLTVLGTSLIVYLIPTILAIIISFAIQGIIKGFSPQPVESTKIEQKAADDDNVNISVGPHGVKISDDDKDTESDKEKMRRMEKRVGIGTAIFELIWMPIIFLISSFTSIITALLYFKTRQAGGESMQDLLTKFEDAEHPRTNWQHRIRDRLIQSGRVSSTEKR